MNQRCNNDEVEARVVTELPLLQMAIAVGDYVKFNTTLHLRESLGEVIGMGRDADTLQVKMFLPLTSLVMKKYSLPPLTAASHPLSCQDNLPEVYQAEEIQYIERCSITDVVFIVPVQEIESGRFFLSGATNAFLIRFTMNRRHGMLPWLETFYFSRRVNEPISVRLFHAVNALSNHIRRCLFHHPESLTTCQSFKLPNYSPEFFWYIFYKVFNYCTSIMLHRKQRAVKYYNSLKMESVAKQSTFIYLHILMKQGFEALQKCLGIGIRLGLSASRPTIKQPIGYCCINSNVTFINCPDIAPADVVANPCIKCHTNGIDLIFSEENRILSGQVRFTKFIVKESADVTTRLSTAVVNTIESGVYLEALFFYNNTLFEVSEINVAENTVRSTAVQDHDVPDVYLSVDAVQTLVQQFGQ